MSLFCSHRKVGARSECAVRGEVDLATMHVLEHAAFAAMDAHGPHLTLDLSEVTFMDCAGLRTLLRVRREALARQGGVDLKGVRAQVCRLLHLTGAGASFPA